MKVSIFILLFCLEKKLYSCLRKKNAKQREKETIGRNILKYIYNKYRLALNVKLWVSELIFYTHFCTQYTYVCWNNFYESDLK